MLNTDQHNPQVKKRMTKQDFLKNNRGIDEGQDLPDELLGAIFDEISTNEIIMKDEKPKVTSQNTDKKSILETISAPQDFFSKTKESKEQPDIKDNMAIKTEVFTL